MEIPAATNRTHTSSKEVATINLPETHMHNGEPIHMLRSLRRRMGGNKTIANTADTGGRKAAGAERMVGKATKVFS